MNNKVLIGFAILLVIFLAVPVVHNLYDRVDAGLELKKAAEEDVPEENDPLKKAYPPIPDIPPMFNASNLPGTVWEVPTKKGVFTIEVLRGGVAVAYPPPQLADMVRRFLHTDSLEGSWSINYDKLTATISVMGRTETVVCDIRGDGLYYNRMPLVRVQ